MKKIDPDAPASEMTIRLRIASEVMAGMPLLKGNSDDRAEFVRRALAAADALIAAANEEQT